MLTGHRSQSGQGLVEYALTIALIALVVFVALLALGPMIGQTFSTINTSLATI